MTSSKQKGGGATRSSKGGQPHTVLMEHYTQHVLQQGTTSPSTPGSTQVIVHQQQQSQSLSSDATLPMINVLRPAKTKLGKARQRMKWTTEVNEYILRTYYLITSLETNCKHYRDTLHRLFNEEFPDVEVCAQRIADQRRAIVKNHLLTQERIDEIRREVELDLQAGGVIHQPQHQQQLQPVASSCSTVVTSHNNNGSLVVSSSVMAKGTAHLTHGSPTMTVWYGCVKEEEPDNNTTDGYHVGSHKLRKLNQGEGVPGGGGQSHEQLQHQQPQHIIIHTTSGGTITTTTTDALRR